MADIALKALSPVFIRATIVDLGRPSIAPEKLLRELLLQVLYTIRSERMLMEQLEYNLLFRWFVGLNMDEPVWVSTVFSKNRDRLLKGDIAEKFFEQVLEQARANAIIGLAFQRGRHAHRSLGEPESFQRKDQGARYHRRTPAIRRSTFTAKSGATTRMRLGPTRKQGWHAKVEAMSRSLPIAAT